jgi:class 3 adenylate cyclase
LLDDRRRPPLEASGGGRPTLATLPCLWICASGVHLGDVVVDDADLLGDGVNIAALVAAGLPEG